ncbi:Wzz/FepE/Etk N-terminal domain-containing protein, partial [Sphingomonas bacterium]|uniref:Wzz/FepE/Etk N-terminal domain-containing protein n=1 Tax=Sphingomonas bacterium TaxID=1895847 RepID=UPI001576D0E3
MRPAIDTSIEQRAVHRHGIGLHEVFRIVAGRWPITVATVALALLLALVSMFLVPRLYQTSTEILISIKPPERVGGPSILEQLAPEYISTQIDIIRSKQVALQVVDRLGLAGNALFVRDSGWRPRDGDLRTYIADMLVRRLHVSQGADMSRTVTISYRAPVRRFADVIANAFAEGYQQASAERQKDPARQASAMYQRAAARQRERLIGARALLSSRQRTLDVSQEQNRATPEQTQLQALASRSAAAERDKAMASAKAGAG